MTGGRINRIKQYVENERFMMTYGDGLCNLDISALLEFHNLNKKTVTLTAIQPVGRFGVLNIDDKSAVESFNEKSKEDTGWITGGFMVLEPEIFNYLTDDSTVFEKYPLEQLAKEKQLAAYKHKGFWQCMDTQRDKMQLEELWVNGEAPWKVW
jgi:glucose-1-phosphate cytidylyltransferase